MDQKTKESELTLTNLKHQTSKGASAPFFVGKEIVAAAQAARRNPTVNNQLLMPN